MATNLLCKISASASKEVCTTKFGVDTAENAPPKGSKLGILKTKENVNENRKFAEIAITKTRRDGDGVGVGFTKRPPNNQLHLLRRLLQILRHLRGFVESFHLSTYLWNPKKNVFSAKTCIFRWRKYTVFCWAGRA